MTPKEVNSLEYEIIQLRKEIRETLDVIQNYFYQQKFGNSEQVAAGTPCQCEKCREVRG